MYFHPIPAYAQHQECVRGDEVSQILGHSLESPIESDQFCAWPLTSHQALYDINGRLVTALFQTFQRGANFAIFSTDLRALLLRPLHCNLTQVGFETH